MFWKPFRAAFNEAGYVTRYYDYHKDTYIATPLNAEAKPSVADLGLVLQGEANPRNPATVF